MKPPIDPTCIPPRVTRHALPRIRPTRSQSLQLTLTPPEWRRLHALALADRRTWQDWCRVLIRRTLDAPRLTPPTPRSTCSPGDRVSRRRPRGGETAAMRR